MHRDQFSHLPADEREAILVRRLDRAQTALAAAERALEGRMRDLNSANRELRKREEDLVERLEMESRQLLAAQRTSGFATIFGRVGEPYQSSSQLNGLFGYPAKRAISPEDVTARIHPLDVTRIITAGQQFFASAEPNKDYQFEHRILHPENGLRWLRWSIRKEVMEGTTNAVYGSVHDITEARANERRVRALQLRAVRRVRELDKLTQELAQERERVESALDIRTRVLSHFAHQFRTPLSSLSGVVDLLRESSRTDAETEALDFAEHATERLVALVDEAIAEAQGEGDEVSLFPAPTELPHLLKQCRTFWKRVGAETSSGASVKFEFAKDLPNTVQVDAVRLRELLDCLIGFGLETKQHTVLSAEWQDGLVLTLSSEAAGTFPKSQELALEPQLRRAHFLAGAMDGSLMRKTGKMPAISAFLRLDKVASKPEQATTMLNAAGEAPHILLAEDTPTIQQVVAALLEKMGCRVDIASDGAEALAAALSHRYDAILMDSQMPVMDGVTALQKLRASGSENSQTPVIGITAHSLQEERDRLIAAGMSTCLSKPIKERDIRSALKTAIMVADGAHDDEQLFDLDRFKAAFEALPVHFHERFLAAVEADIDSYGKELTDAVNAQDAELADRKAHALKGVAANIGAIKLVDALDVFRASDDVSSDQLFSEICEQLTATRAGCGRLFAAMISDQ